MDAMSLVALLAFAMLIVSWAFLPANGYAPMVRRPKAAALTLEPVTEGQC